MALATVFKRIFIRKYGELLYFCSGKFCYKIFR